MAERVSQAPLLVLERHSPPTRTSQSAILVLYKEAIPSRISQAPLLLLERHSSPTWTSQSAILLLARYVPCFTRWAQCWRIERRDGVVFTFTSHDEPVVFRGETYRPCESLNASASELGSELGAAGNLDLSGIIADDSISEADLYAGLFDRAILEVWMVPWHTIAGEGPFRLNAGVTGNLSQGDAGFAMEVLTPSALLQQRSLLDIYTPGCRWRLGDARCGVDLDALAVSGTVTAEAALYAVRQAQHRIFWDSSRSEADGYFNQGTVLWTSGANAGQQAEVKSFDGGAFVLWNTMQYPIQVGDQYEARPGCSKTPDACKNKFDNYVNYGGFPDVPGRDGIMGATPDSR